MKTFVTGATGFVGREIVSQLHMAGHNITIFARYPESRAVLELVQKYQTTVVAGDVLNANTLRLEGAEAVIHLVGIIGEVGTSTFDNVHRQGTENVVRAACKAGVERYVQMSALGARADAMSRYHQSKWQAEETVRQSGLAYTIFRPSIIYGAGDQFVNQFAQIARWSPFLPVIGSGTGTLQPIAVECVAKAFVRALEKPEAIGKTFDLAGSEVLTLPQILDQIMVATGRKRMKMPVPLPAAKCLADFLEAFYPKLSGKTPPLNRDQLIMLEEKTIGNPQPANELFDLKQAPFSKGLEAMFCTRK